MKRVRTVISLISGSCLLGAIACTVRAPQAADYAEPGVASRFGTLDDMVFASQEDAEQTSGPAFVRYPEGERGRGVEASLGLAFALDTTGRVEYRSVSFIGNAAPAFLNEVCRFLRNSRFAPVRRNGSIRRAFVVSEFTFTLEPQNSDEPRLHVQPVDVEELRRTFAAKGLAESVKELDTHRHCG